MTELVYEPFEETLLGASDFALAVSAAEGFEPALGPLTDPLEVLPEGAAGPEAFPLEEPEAPDDFEPELEPPDDLEPPELDPPDDFDPPPEPDPPPEERAPPPEGP